MKFSIYFYQNRGTISNMLFPWPWVKQLHLDQGCMSQISILRQFSSENGPLFALTGNNLLSTIACVTKSLSAIVCSVCGWLRMHQISAKRPIKCSHSDDVSHISFYPFGVMLSASDVFTTRSETKDEYRFIGKMGSKVKGGGPSTEGRWKVCDSEIISSLCTNAPKPFLVLICVWLNWSKESFTTNLLPQSLSGFFCGGWLISYRQLVPHWAYFTLLCWMKSVKIHWNTWRCRS